MKFTPEQFIGEEIEPIFDNPPRLEKVPSCPDGFVWREETYRIAGLINEWHDYERKGRMAHNMQPHHAALAARRGSWGVGRNYFRVRTDADRTHTALLTLSAGHGLYDCLISLRKELERGEITSKSCRRSDLHTNHGKDDETDHLLRSEHCQRRQRHRDGRLPLPRSPGRILPPALRGDQLRRRRRHHPRHARPSPFPRTAGRVDRPDHPGHKRRYAPAGDQSEARSPGRIPGERRRNHPFLERRVEISLRRPVSGRLRRPQPLAAGGRILHRYRPLGSPRTRRAHRRHLPQSRRITALRRVHRPGRHPLQPGGTPVRRRLHLRIPLRRKLDLIDPTPDIHFERHDEAQLDALVANVRILQSIPRRETQGQFDEVDSRKRLEKLELFVESLEPATESMETCLRLWKEWSTGRDRALLLQPAELVFSRYDTNLANCLWDNGRLRFVDLEYATWTERVFDLAEQVEHAQSRGTPDATWERFIDRFELPPQERRRFKAAQRLVAFEWVRHYGGASEEGQRTARFKSHVARLGNLCAL